jgi:hypothetical protein
MRDSLAYTDSNCDSDGITKLHTVGVAEQGKHAY